MASPSGRSITLISGDAHRMLAEDLARELSVPLSPVEMASFADGETRVSLTADVRGEDVFILQPTSPPVNNRLMTLALMIDAARAAGAAKITALVPYFGYARQEQRGQPGSPLSAQVAARLLASVGLDHLVVLDVHAPALESAFPMPATLLGCDELFLPLVKSWRLENITVVSPDAGGMKRAQRFAAALDAGLAVVAKDRPQPDRAAPLQVLGEVRDRTCIIVDDMASTGRTLAGAAESLRRSGAKEVHAIFTHAVMCAEALGRLTAAPLERIVTSDSISAPQHSQVTVVRTAPLLAKSVRYLHGEKPASA